MFYRQRVFLIGFAILFGYGLAALLITLLLSWAANTWSRAVPAKARIFVLALIGALLASFVPVKSLLYGDLSFRLEQGWLGLGLLAFLVMFSFPAAVLATKVGTR